MMMRSFRSVDSSSLSILSQTIPVDYRVREMIARRYLIGGFSSFSPRSIEMIQTELGNLGISPRSNYASRPDHPPWHSTTSHSQSVMLSPNSLLSSQAIQQLPVSLLTDSSAAEGEASREQVLKKQVIISRVRKSLEHLWSAEWKAAEQGRTTRSFFPSPMCARALRRKHLPYQLVQIFTGHSYLNAHLARIGFVPSPSCSCGTPAENMEHFLFHCPNFSTAREVFVSACEHFIGIWPPPVSIIHKFHPVVTALSSFVRKSGRLNHPNT